MPAAPVASDRAPGLLLSPDARVADDVQIGCNVVIHGLVEVASGAVIQDNVILGKVARLAAHSTASRDLPDPLVVGEGAAVCSAAIVFAGARLGAGVIIGDQAYVRERSSIGERSVVGRGSAVDNDVTIGDRVRIQTMVYLTAYSLVEDDVFIGPTVSTYNDDTMSRHDPEYDVRGATIRRAARIGGGAKLRPGIEIGEEAFVAMGSVVTRDVPARRLVRGVPARVVGTVEEADLLENWR
jgi:acetyltransferase-like isoleucine patch superfamily enzyme